MKVRPSKDFLYLEDILNGDEVSCGKVCSVGIAELEEMVGKRYFFTSCDGFFISEDAVFVHKVSILGEEYDC